MQKHQFFQIQNYVSNQKIIVSDNFLVVYKILVNTAETAQSATSKDCRLKQNQLKKTS